MDAFHFVDYMPTSDNEEGKNECLPSIFRIYSNVSKIHRIHSVHMSCPGLFSIEQ